MALLQQARKVEETRACEEQEVLRAIYATVGGAWRGMPLTEAHIQECEEIGGGLEREREERSVARSLVFLGSGRRIRMGMLLSWLPLSRKSDGYWKLNRLKT